LYTTIRIQENSEFASGDTINIAAGRGPVFTLVSAVAAGPPVLISIQGLTISHGNHSGGTGAGGGVQVNLALQKSYVIQNNPAGISGNVVLSLSGSTIKDNVGHDICLPDNCGRLRDTSDPPFVLPQNEDLFLTKRFPQRIGDVCDLPCRALVVDVNQKHGLGS